MTIAVSGDSITFNDLSVQASAQVGMKNRIIDGGFIINQRGYVSAANLGAGGYGHDRWKGGVAATNTYTFTQGALGVNTTVTITAGTLVQVIEGCNLAEGGTYVLSWTGTAQGRLNGGTYGASGTVTVTEWVAGTNLNVEFNTGTVGSIQLEKGSTATSFDYRDYGRELIMCQRYCLVDTNEGGLYVTFASGTASSTTGFAARRFLPVTMRAIPSLVTNGAGNFLADQGNVAPVVTGITLSNSSTKIVSLAVTVASGLTGGSAVSLVSDGLTALRSLTYSAEI